MFGFKSVLSKRLEEMVKLTVDRIVTDSENKYNKQLKLMDEIESLREQLETLRIEKARRDEEFNRRDREVTHKLGLERMRQEQEEEQHKKQIELEIREGNLSASEQRFKDQMEFQRKQLEVQIVNLQGLVQKVFEKIPDVKHETRIIKRLTGRK